jgi:hypothetical protein
MQLHLKVQAADSTALKSESFVGAQVPNNENLLELPQSKAIVAKFPPGALVLFTDVSNNALVVFKGIVEAVFIDLSPENSTREYIFRVRIDNDMTTAMAVEAQLQWAPTCPVWLKSLQKSEQKSAFVIGSCQGFVDAKPEYSVQVAGFGIVHGVAADSLCYRPAVGVPAVVEEDTSLSGTSTSGDTSASSAIAPAKRSFYSSDTYCQAPLAKRSKNLVTLPTQPANEGSQALESHEASSLYESTSTPSVSSSAAGTQDDEICTLRIKVPHFADPARLRGKSSLTRLASCVKCFILTVSCPKHSLEAIIGPGGINHKRLLRDTGCHEIDLNLQPSSMQVTMTADSNKIETAQEMIEDVIVSTASYFDQAKMLYYLAVDNNYGASNGPARYQRSPNDHQEWVWMAVVETPRGFDNCTGLFMDRNARAVKQMIQQSGVNIINVSDSFPKFIYIMAYDPHTVNKAVELVKGRVQWTMNESARREKHWR